MMPRLHLGRTPAVSRQVRSLLDELVSFTDWRGDLEDDWNGIMNRAKHLWAPQLREPPALREAGAPTAAPAASPAAEPEAASGVSSEDADVAPPPPDSPPPPPPPPEQPPPPPPADPAPPPDAAPPPAGAGVLDVDLDAVLDDIEFEIPEIVGAADADADAPTLRVPGRVAHVYQARHPRSLSPDTTSINPPPHKPPTPAGARRPPRRVGAARLRAAVCTPARASHAL